MSWDPKRVIGVLAVALLASLAFLLFRGEWAVTRCERIERERLRRSAQEVLYDQDRTAYHEGRMSLDTVAARKARLDSVPTVRPSDAAWALEHCWQGRPR